MTSLAFLGTISSCGTFETDRADPGFVIGVWQQPAEAIPGHVADGINTFVSRPGDVDRQVWLSTVLRSHLHVIVEPPVIHQEGTEQDSQFKILAYLMPDEADLNSTLRSESLRIVTRLRSIRSKVPIMVNFSGSVLTGQQSDDLGKEPGDDLYRDLSKHANIISHDIYPIAGWNKPEWIDLSRRESSVMADALKRLAAIQGGATRYAFVETGTQNLPWLSGLRPSPTSEQVRAQVWDAILNGARGIVYFTIALDPFSWDARTPECRSVIAKTNSEIHRYESCIMRHQGPVIRSGSLQYSSFSDDNGRSVTVSVNLSSKQQANGSETFEPYEVRFDERGY